MIIYKYHGGHGGMSLAYHLSSLFSRCKQIQPDYDYDGM